jgi:hypothetical protein
MNHAKVASSLWPEHLVPQRKDSWARTAASARSKAFNAMGLFEAVERAVGEGKLKPDALAPASKAIRSNPWIHVIVFEMRLAEMMTRVSNGKSKAANPLIDECREALFYAERDLALNSSDSSAITYFKLGILWERLGRFQAPKHLAELNTKRAQGGAVRLAIRDVLMRFGGMLRPIDVLDYIPRWALKDEALWSRQRDGSASKKRAISWARFQTIVSEEKRAIRNLSRHTLPR